MKNYDMDHRVKGILYPRMKTIKYVIEIEYEKDLKVATDYDSNLDARSYADYILSGELIDLSSLKSVYLIVYENGLMVSSELLYKGDDEIQINILFKDGDLNKTQFKQTAVADKFCEIVKKSLQKEIISIEYIINGASELIYENSK